jgi:hypothetical protein
MLGYFCMPGGGDVAVSIECEGYGAVPEEFLHDLGMHATSEEVSRRGVSQVVDPEAR